MIDKENFHLFLLAGQSNMAGRGFINDQNQMTHPRVLMVDRSGNWIPATDPIHFDKSEAGIGPGLTFASTLVEADKSITIGLIPTACGGSPISSWVPGGYHDQTKSHPYDDAIARMKQAMKSGTLKAVLWHQGEADTGDELSKSYQESLENLIKRFRSESGNSELPIVIGQLGHFLTWSDGTHRVDQAHQTIANNDKFTTFVPSNGLTSNPDQIHIDAESQREFGYRYAKAYQQLVHSNM